MVLFDSNVRNYELSEDDEMNKLSLAFFIITLTILCPLLSIDSSADQSFKSIKSKGLSGSAKLNSNLKGIINEMSEMVVTRGDNQSFNLSDLSNPLIKVDDDGNVEVFLYCNEVSDENLEQLLDLGLIVEDLNEEHKIIQGWMPYENLEQAAEMGFVVKVTPPSYAHTRVGSVTTEGDGPIRADDARNTFGVDGSGIKIGVISDGVDSRGMSQATGDLPGFIDIGDPGDGDEGTAMLEIIHDVAPGAELAFHTAFPTSVQFLNAINFFMNKGVDIIVDEEVLSANSTAWSTRAATAAKCGAEAEVPKKVPNPGAVVDTPSGPEISGLALSSDIAALWDREASEGDIIDTGPWELKGSIMSGVIQSKAATAKTPEAAGCSLQGA